MAKKINTKKLFLNLLSIFIYKEVCQETEFVLFFLNIIHNFL